MRPKNDILQEVNSQSNSESIEQYQGRIFRRILESLLDIRDLLAHPIVRADIKNQ